jgi:ADP-ribose pyrophosphatase YjhB (NUDIX family)
MQSKRFNLRVYGLLIWNNRILVSDEWIGEHQFTKFPGGGLEWGEGLEECVKREFLEEIGLEIEADGLYYVTDFFQVSAFRPNDQIVSFYYKVSSSSPDKIAVRHSKFDFGEDKLVFRWVNLSDLNPEEFRFPIDRIVVQKLIDSL